MENFLPRFSHREAWLRLNGPLVGRIRRHFLLWRAVTDARKRELYDEARRLLEAGTEPRSDAHG